MIREIVGISFALLFAITFVAADEEGCEATKPEACLDILLNALAFTQEEELCAEFRKVLDCYSNVVEQCMEGDERDPEIDAALQELNDQLEDKCPAAQVEEVVQVDEKSETENCLEENAEYIVECVTDSIAKLDDLFGDVKGDMDLFKCTSYGVVSHCLVERADEKCGDSGRLLVEEEMADMPPSVKKACDKVNAQEQDEEDLAEIFSVHLLDQRKK